MKDTKLGTFEKNLRTPDRQKRKANREKHRAIIAKERRKTTQVTLGGNHEQTKNP